MKSFRKFLVTILGIFVALLTSILVMIKGWGLKPHNWWWIIGVYLLGYIVSLLILGEAKG